MRAGGSFSNDDRCLNVFIFLHTLSLEQSKNWQEVFLHGRRSLCWRFCTSRRVIHLIDHYRCILDLLINQYTQKAAIKLAAFALILNRNGNFNK